MKDITVNGLCKCRVCGGNTAALLSNAKNQFQVRCMKCGKRTKWERKSEAIIDWFNYYLYGESYKKKVAIK